MREIGICVNVKYYKERVVMSYGLLDPFIAGHLSASPLTWRALSPRVMPCGLAKGAGTAA
ncbi:protein of unknown function [Candidatus Promineifilum breve]|uniref:Uncharacterized protein n=1 Tax=Candidatus Promineifilum breve TaxID=1806508 RepID=A0A160T2C6_9CHLR|nr:protein of unknown function [Candidatus Promineifilum breve]